METSSLIHSRLVREETEPFDVTNITTTTTTKREKEDKEQQTNPTQDMLENIAWVLASALAFYYSDLVHVVLYDESVYRTLLVLALSLIGVNVAIAVYLIVWVTLVNKVNADKWTELYPTLIPIATGSCALGTVL